MQKKIIASLLMATSASWADVNMRDAAFLKTMNEFSSGLMERTYSSRSLWNGSFGFGWCSQFEKKLSFSSPGKALLKNCDRSTPVKVQMKKNQWVYQSSQSRGVETYDSDGRLVSTSFPKAELSYDLRGRLTQLRTDSEKIDFQYDENAPQIRKARSSKGISMEYKYHDGNLASVLFGSQRIDLQYDPFHNLTAVKSPRETEVITYNQELDEVTSYHSSLNACTEFYQFERVSKFELKSSAFRKCPASPLKIRTFTFRARRNPQGALVLSSLRITGDQNDKTFLP